MKAEDIKFIVQEKYGQIARKSQLQPKSSCCCGPSCCGGEADYSAFSEDYRQMEGYCEEADLSLGCGIPTEFAGIKAGDTVIDLGSGAGNDCFVARALTGEQGKVIGIDFTEEMIEKARSNTAKLGFSNVEFRTGDIENMSVEADLADVIISNCVLNLVPDKKKAFAEIFRVLKPGGRVCVSDVVIKGDLPEKIRQNAVMYVGCVSGALEMDEYMKIIQEQGFKNMTIHKQKKIDLPDEVLANCLSREDIIEIKKSTTGIFSITVSAEK